MTTFKFGLAHAPVTPFADGKVDTAGYGKILDFHLKHGAEQLALPMHAGESVSLTADERKALLEFAVGHVKGRAPIIVNVSEAGTALACALASHAEKAGAAALIANVPYYWTPPQSMLVEHFAAIAKAASGIPLFVLNAPDEMNNVEIKSNTVVELLNKAPNFLGLIDSSLDWQYMIEIVTLGREARPDFQFVSGTEYMISAAAVGATGMISSVAGIAPTVVKELYELCRIEKFKEARPAQEKIAILYRALQGRVSALKAALTSMGRDSGTPRPPLPELDEASRLTLLVELASASTPASEPRGWV